MNLKLILVLLALLAGFYFFNRGLGTTTDHPEFQNALARAKAENKLVLLDFTGSDWCGWCMKMQEETFSRPAFREFEDANLIMVKVDFPQNHRLPDDLRSQNSGLKRKFGAKAYPTYVLVDAEGEEIARHRGYLGGGPEAFIRWVRSAKGGA